MQNENYFLPESFTLDVTIGKEAPAYRQERVVGAT
jgi:hypothetical protein